VKLEALAGISAEKMFQCLGTFIGGEDERTKHKGDKDSEGADEVQRESYSLRLLGG